MPFEITCLGAGREVGRSSFLVRTDKNILMDYGIKIFDKSGWPKYPEGFNENLDLMLLSHAHLDHSGFLPYLYTFSKVNWFGTPPTRDLIEILIADSMKIMGNNLPFNITHYKKALKYWVPAIYKQSMHFGNSEIKFFDAGHISGSAMVELTYNGKRLLYSGDFKMESTRMHYGADYRGKVDALIVDSTYAQREHPQRAELEQMLVGEIEETTNNRGNVLLPAFSLGRSQELIRIIRAYNKKIPIYLDGMGRDITGVYLKYSKYIRDGEGFRKDVNSITMVRTPNERRHVPRKPSVIISSAGMLEGGPALGYLMNLNPESKIIFTGYNVEGTNGWRLLNEGKCMVDGNELSVELPVGYLDFSAHGGRSDIFELIKRTKPKKIICVHGDNTEEFATELREKGYEAVAPLAGETMGI